MRTREAAKLAGVHRDTLLRWLRLGLVPEPARDRHGWRVFTREEGEQIARFATGDLGASGSRTAFVREPSDDRVVSSLKSLDWDFADANTGYLTHRLHPYPAKFIPQIPNALIQELSSVGDTVLDPFCGSGTTLVEALLLKRDAIGIDANPIASLITRAKTIRLSQTDLQALRELEDRARALAIQFSSAQGSLFTTFGVEPLVKIPSHKSIEFWFEPHVVDELAHVKSIIDRLPTEAARLLGLAAFSSIIVSVSRQDSDTRYVRREKNIAPGDASRRFQRALSEAINQAIEFTDLVEPRFTALVIHSDVLDAPDLDPVDLVVSSPPYPNAYSYHLYHMTRMLWFDMDPVEFKRREIGSHRKYSRKGPNRATVDTFREEMGCVFRWLGRTLKSGGYCCFVIGDSILDGQIVQNDRVIVEVATATGFKHVTTINRRLQDSRKSFNPKIGKIKQEHVVILRNRGAHE